MPLYDYECKKCGRITEHFAKADERLELVCECGGDVRRIISISGQYCGNQDAPWLKSVVDVVDKTSRKPHVRAFVENPTRSNYKRWMQGEGIKPVDHTEHGAPPVARKPEPTDTSRIRQEVWERHRARHRIEI